MNAYTEQLAAARNDLITARTLLRERVYLLAVQKALAETHATAEAGGPKALGSNAEERERALVIALDADEDYRRCLIRHEDAAVQVESLQAELDTLRDQRRERQLRALERLIELMESGTAGPVLAAIGALG